MSQPLKQKAPETNTQDYARSGYFILISFMLAALLAGVLFAYLGFVNDYPQLFIVPAFLTASILLGFWLLSLNRTDRTTLAMSFVIAAFLIDVSVVSIFVQNLGLVFAITAMIVTIAITGAAMPPKYSSFGIVIGVFAGLALFLLDINLGNNRLQAPQLEANIPYIVASIAVLTFIVVIQRYKRFSLRIKIAIGILVTGAITVSALTIYGLNSAGIVVNTLTSKFEKSIGDQIDAQIKSSVQIEADKTNDLFSETLHNLQALAEYRANLETRRDLFADGVYWNSREKVFQLSNGQYGNPPTDIASVFIPNKYTLNEEMLVDLNTTAYLDFAAPDFLEANPKVSAVYYISASGATTYYPNNDLARNIPADFDSPRQPFFTIADPQNNPERLPRWTPVYRDPAGSGLIVTLSIPVYANNVFKGVIGADLKLAQIAETISNIKVEKSGFAFLVDSEGHIIALPLQGYTLFGMQPEQIPINESPKQTILGKGSNVLQETTQHIVNGETNLAELEINGVNMHIGFTPLKTIPYRLAIVAPVDELNRVILTTREDINNRVAVSLQNMLILLIALFVGASLISLGVGQVITSPLLRLTKTVEQIAAGNFSARASIETQDETGMLANSFNVMTEKLNDTLLGLEERVSERTRELEKANEGNVRRAAQFEAVARIARTISSTQKLDTLLPQITETISAEFDFYHVGIFLLDNHREFAVLVAANSEGGKRMLARNHRLQVGEIGIVGYVTNIGQPRVALDVGLDAAYFNNPDLPDTHSEIALPLRIGSDIFGALDVQSTQTNAFANEDISILSTLADQVSIAIQNARSYQQTSEALAQAENASYQLSGQQWKRFLANQTVEGYYFDGIDTKTITRAEKQRPHNLAIPLTLRGSQIGSIKLSALDPNREWSDDEISMIEAAAERTALALENARLLLESQKRASKERTIGEISAKIGGLTNLESILQTAIQELGNTLPGVDVAVQFTDTPTRK